MPKGTPKRAIFALLALLGALALAACGGDSGDGNSGSSGDSGGDQFTSAGFQSTLDTVKTDNADAELLEVQITSAGTDYKIRDGEQATGFHFDPGSTEAQDVEVELVGSGSVADSAFPIADVDPAAIDKMISDAPAAIGADDFEVTVMTLGKNFTAELGWTLNGDAAGRTALVLQAKPDGSGLSAPGGTVPGGDPTGGTDPGATDTGAGTSTPTAPGTDPSAIADCIQQAAGDVAKIQACAGQ